MKISVNNEDEITISKEQEHLMWPGHIMKKYKNAFKENWFIAT